MGRRCHSGRLLAVLSCIAGAATMPSAAATACCACCGQPARTRGGAIAKASVSCQPSFERPPPAPPAASSCSCQSSSLVGDGWISAPGLPHPKLCDGATSSSGGPGNFGSRILGRRMKLRGSSMLRARRFTSSCAGAACTQPSAGHAGSTAGAAIGAGSVARAMGLPLTAKAAAATGPAELPAGLPWCLPSNVHHGGPWRLRLQMKVVQHSPQDNVSLKARCSNGTSSTQSMLRSAAAPNNMLPEQVAHQQVENAPAAGPSSQTRRLRVEFFGCLVRGAPKEVRRCTRALGPLQSGRAAPSSLHQSHPNKACCMAHAYGTPIVETVCLAS